MSDSQPSSSPRWLAPLLLGAVVAVCYANSLGGVFLYDDAHAIVSNPAVRTLTAPSSGANAERPLAIWTFAVNYTFGDLDPAGYHVVNAVIHWLAGVMTWLLLRRLFAVEVFPETIRNRADVLAVSVAVIWLAHPLCTQAVTYIVQRMESLASLLMLVSLYAVARAEGRWNGWIGLACVSGATGMLVKPIVLTLPVLAVLCDRVVTFERDQQAGRRVLLGCVLAVAVLAPNGPYLWSKWKTIGSKSAASTDVVVTSGNDVPADQTPVADIPTREQRKQQILTLKRKPSSWEYLRTQPEVLLHYLRLSVFPVGLTFDYNWPVQDSLAVTLVCGVVIVALLAWTAWAVWKSPGWGLLAAWPWVILAPTSSILPIEDLAYEHRMYLPLVGVLALVFARGLASRVTDRKTWGLTVALVAIVCGGLTISRNTDYASEFVIWTDVCEKAPWNGRAWNNVGDTWMERDRPDIAADCFAKALALETVPTRRVLMLHNEALARYDLNEDERVVELADEAIEVADGVFATPFFLRGSVALKEGRSDAALADLNRAVELDPTHFGAWTIRGQAHLIQNRPAEAAEDYERSLSLNPDQFTAVANLALAFSKLGKDQEAIAAYSRGIKMRPDDWALYADRGEIFRRNQLYEPALQDFRTVLENAPNLSPGWLGAIRTLVETGRPAVARPLVERFQQLGGKLPDDLAEQVFAGTE